MMNLNWKKNCWKIINIKTSLVLRPIWFNIFNNFLWKKASHCFFFFFLIYSFIYFFCEIPTYLEISPTQKSVQFFLCCFGHASEFFSIILNTTTWLKQIFPIKIGQESISLYELLSLQAKALVANWWTDISHCHNN